MANQRRELASPPGTTGDGLASVAQAGRPAVSTGPLPGDPRRGEVSRCRATRSGVVRQAESGQRAPARGGGGKTSDEEAAPHGLLARRMAAGYTRRGRS